MLGAALVVGAAALWATFGLFAKGLYARGYTPLELASVRAFIGWASIALIALPRLRSLHIPVRDLPFFAVYGVIGFALFELLYFAAVERAPVSVAAALLYTAPAFVLVLSRLFLGEAIDGRRLAALAAVLAGVLLVTGALRTSIVGSGAITTAAAGLGLASGLTYALYTILSALALRRTGSVGALFWCFGFAALVLAPFAPPLPVLLRDPAALPLVLGLGLVPTLFAYALFLGGLRHLRATVASMVAAVEPVLAAGLAALVLGERLFPEQGLGVLCIAAGAVAVERAAARTREEGERSPAPPPVRRRPDGR